MNPAPDVLAELRTILDAICEERATPAQLRRLEELVLGHPAAEQHYVRFMSFYADLIDHVAGLPEPRIETRNPSPNPLPAAERGLSDPAPPSLLGKGVGGLGSSVEPKREKPMRKSRVRWAIALALLVGVVGFAGYQYATYRGHSRPVREAETALAAKQADLERAKAEKAAAEADARKPVETATNAERQARADFAAAQEAARKAIEAKDFFVRLTGPAHIQPGAPNKWQVETLRHGEVVRPDKMDVIVKDGGDKELYRQSHTKSVGVVSLELTPAFWEKVKPGTELFLEVAAHSDDGRKSSVSEKLPLARPVYVTHLVTDKPLYKPGEVVRFRSLTLDRASLLPPTHDTAMSFRLRDPSDTAVQLASGTGRVLRDLQGVNGPDGKPLRGIGVGEYALPPDAPGGEYKLDLFETVDGRESRLETRKFIVNRYVPDVFEKKLEFDGKSYGAGDYVQARLDVSRTAGGAMPTATADVEATIDGKPIHKQTGATFVVTDGKTILDVRFRLPSDLFALAKSGAAPSATLSVAVRDGSDTEAIVRPIPLVTKTLNVEFFPEGGDMIAGVPGRVYVMVRTPQGKPADLRGAITDGTQTITEVATLTDAENPGVNRGHGVFTLTPQAGKRYFLKLSTPIGVTEPMPEGYPLPAPKADGVSLTALDAVTPRDGAVRVRLATPLGPKLLHVGAYARGRLIAHQKVELQANAPAEIALKGDDAGGVTRVTVFEEGKGDGVGRALLVARAERLVYRGTSSFLNLDATPDKSRYTPGDKVKLDLTATTEGGKPTGAVLLVAVVNRSVITMADNKNDRLLPTHFLLSGDVKHPAELEHADFLLTDHPKAATALDLLLGTQGWRRFAEQDVAPANPLDRPEVDRMLVSHGQRTSAPVELFKLEAQRVTAEFAPRMEQAKLAAGRAEAAWKDVTGGLAAKMTAAQSALFSAEGNFGTAKAEYAAYKSRLRRVLPTAQEAIVLMLVAAGALLLLIAATRPAEGGKAWRMRPLVVAGGAVGAVGAVVVVLAAVSSIAKKVESTTGWSSEEHAASEVAGWRADSPRAVAKGGARPPVPMAAAPMAFPEGPSVGASEGTAPAGGRGSGRGPTPGASSGGAPPARGMVVRTDDGTRMRLPANNPASPSPDQAKSESPIPSFVVREYAHERNPALGDVRSDFTETVYWHPVLVLPTSGKASVNFQLSDDVARYQVLVAGHTTDGRIGAVTKTIEARKPFSLDPKLPLEMSHTDAVDVAVRVTNDSDVRRNVSFTATAAGLKADAPLSHIFDLAPNAKSRKLFRLTPAVLKGDATVRVEGTSIPAADKDVIARTVRIVPDGFPGVGAFSDTLTGKATGVVTLPKDLVPGTLKVRLEVYPTALSDLLNGIDGMLREPMGCFEQTSSFNYPNTLVLDYLNQARQPNPQAAARAKQLLERGYARLTSFECMGTKLGIKHGFEWFGAADRQHEALTAYGLLQFKDMSRVSPVDPALIRRTQDFLLSRRDGKGGFNFRGDGLHSWGAPKHVVSAYITWALVESDPTDADRLDLKAEIAALKAAATDETSTAGKDPYFVALVANILLHRANRETAYKLLDRIQEKHFKNGAVTGATTSITRSGGRDLDIETTSLAMLGWMRANDPKYQQTVRASAKWLSGQRGGYGGFGGTQATVLTLKSLVLFSTKFARPAETGEFVVTANGKRAAARPFGENDVEVIAVDIPDAEAVFKPGERTEVEISTTAKHSYPFALTYSYSTLTPLSAEACAVRVSTKLAKAKATEGETVSLAFSLENRRKSGYGMATAVVGIPAGMKVPTDMKQLTELREKERVDFFEVRGRELVLYWRELAPEQKVDLTIDLVCETPGVFRGPASRAYLYYDADHKHWVEPLSITITPAE